MLPETQRLIAQTRRELGKQCAGPIRHTVKGDSTCLAVPLRSGRELRLEQRCGTARLIFSIHSAVTLPRPLAYDPDTARFSEDPFGGLLNDDPELLAATRRLVELTLLPGYRHCLIRAEGRPRRTWWGGRTVGVRRFLEVVDRIEQVLGGVCHGTSELNPIPTEAPYSAKDVQDIFANFGDLFGEIFGANAARGEDLTAELSLQVEEALRGCKKSLTFDRRLACPACDGRGAEGGSARSACPACNGKGQSIREQGFFLVSSTCERCNGAGFSHTRPCRFCEGEGRVTKDQTVVVTVPAGVPEGATLRLRGLGNQRGSGGDAGDLYVSLRLEDPT